MGSKDRVEIDEEEKRWEGPSVGQPLSSTAQILFKNTDCGHVVMCGNKNMSLGHAAVLLHFSSACPQTPGSQLFRQNNDE